MEIHETYNRWKVDAIQFFFGSPGGLIVPGASKFGGNPDLPADFVWPTFTAADGQTRSLAFLVQVDCEQILALDVDGLLPRTGRLYFFYDIQTEPNGSEPAHRGGCYVHYDHSAPEKLVSFPAPADVPQAFLFPEIPLRFENAPNLPGEECLSLYMDEDFAREYHGQKLCDLQQSLGVSPSVLCKLLGYANAIQGDMLTQCELTAGRGISTSGEIPPMTAAERQLLREDAMDWMLLFQLDSLRIDSQLCEKFSLNFGRSGRLFVYIRRQDLALQRFDRCWFILQSY